MAKQTRQTSKRLRAAESRDKAQATRTAPLRIDVDRGLARGLIGLLIAIISFLALNLDTIRDTIRKEPSQLFSHIPLGIAILVSAAALLMGVYLYTHARRLVSSKTKLFIFGLLWVLPLVVARAAAFGEPTASFASANFVPLGAAVFIIALCHGSQVAITSCFVLSLLVAVALRNDGASFPIMHPAAIPLLGGALVWTFGARRIRKRLWLLGVGLIAAVVQLWLVIGVELLTQPKVSNAGLWAAANGVITGAVLTALLPIIEYLFSVNTEISLLELSDLNQPVMRQLGLQAPGTYHHSLIVGSLAETAAEALGADPLLARVGSYFHDIGKLQKPGYFAENEGTQGSRHGQLSPSMSALIIGAHVKDGAEMAEEYNLPRAIIDIIEQHHGTSLMEFFYYRSKETDNGDDEETTEDMFRYPGPKPRTREAAIIMIADAVEAASRTLPEPSPARLQTLVHGLTMKKLLDNQLDECPMTLTDLAKAEKSFVRVLAAIFHSRVKYPEAPTESTVIQPPLAPNGVKGDAQ
jgi:cyclic-di-AMP phosphodiesterase PgpH